MPYIIGLLWGAFGLTLKSMVGRVLLALGISFITYQGVDLLLDSMHDAAFAHLNSTAVDLIGIVGLAKIPQSLNVVFSALAARYALQGLTSSFSKMVIK